MVARWSEVQFGELCEHSAFGPRFSSAEYAPDGNVATLRTTDISPDGRIEYQAMPIAKLDLLRFEHHLLKKDDLVITRSGRVGTTAVFAQHSLPVLPGAFLIRFRLKREIADPLFYRYFFNSPFGQELLASVATGSVQQNVNITSLHGLRVPNPPLHEQHFIAAVLEAFDNKIELNRRMNETLEALIQSLFKSWFVDAIQTELPKGWRESRVRELASNIQYGLTQSASTEPVGPRFLRITDIQGGRVDWDSVPFCEVSQDEHERYRLNVGDILVARTGASTGENLYLRDAPDAVFASYLVRFQFANRAMARFVGAFMRTSAYSDFVEGCIGGQRNQMPAHRFLPEQSCAFHRKHC